MKRTTLIPLILVAAALLLGVPARLVAQFNVEGDFRVRWYSDSFLEANDSRGKENYMRYLARIRAKTKAGENTTFATELISLIDNPGQPVRNIAGTGPMRFGISQLYAETTIPEALIFDVVRFRIGRQQFPIGNGLSWGESYYMLNKFDGARIDVLYDPFTLSLFGAITGQNLSSSGLYPDPGSDQMYAARIGTTLWDQTVMAYGILNRPRGIFNDSYIGGIGANGQIMVKDLEYFVEGAYQQFNQVPGFPDKAGIGYMGGIGYRWGMGPFRSIKVETRYAAYEGDNAKTTMIEQFSPLSPSFYWGSRTGYVDGEIGGDYPNNGKNLEGCRIWYTRVYFILRELPKLRFQLQYVNVDEYVNNDGVNTMDDEVSARLYYALSSQSQVQFRFSRVMPNDGDHDLDGGGVITSSEDRMFTNSFMMEWQITF
jgi:hypothetical protein